MEKMSITAGNSILLAKNQENMTPKMTYLGKVCIYSRLINIMYCVFVAPNRKNIQNNRHRTVVPP